VKNLALFVEGHGEVQAAGNLVARLAAASGVEVRPTQVLRWPKLHRADGVVRAVRYSERLPVQGALLLRDEDDGCPRDEGPRLADLARSTNPKLPVAVVLMHREYEVVFLPCIAGLAGKPLDGRPGLRADAAWTGPWEGKRDVKGWLTERMPPGRAYKPSVDQLPLTRMIDVKQLLSADVPCVATLVRALRFLATSNVAGVYPPG
jgi:hypothetical protein